MKKGLRVGGVPARNRNSTRATYIPAAPSLRKSRAYTYIPQLALLLLQTREESLGAKLNERERDGRMPAHEPARAHTYNISHIYAHRRARAREKGKGVSRTRVRVNSRSLSLSPIYIHIYTHRSNMCAERKRERDGERSMYMYTG